MRLTPVIAMFALASGMASATAKQQSPQARNATTQIIEFAGQKYRFPKQASVERYRSDDQDVDAISVGLYHPFWLAVLKSVGPVTGWVAVDNGIPRPTYISRPGNLFQFVTDIKSPLPAVRGPVSLLREKGAMRVWSSQDPEIYIDGLVYVTFANRPDMYLQCKERDIGDWRRSCTLFWYDKGALHHFSVAGDTIERAPDVLASYQSAIAVR